MTEITRAETNNQAHETETESRTERQMRSDFMHAEHYNLRCRGNDDYDPADELAYREYSSPWFEGEKQWADEWQYLSDATDRWTDDYAAAQRRLDFHQRAGWLTPTELRSEQQARDIANHGIETDDSGLLTSPYVTRVQERADSETATPSPLANHRPGNALAAHQANSERDGIER
ncbi:hypothetical protein [Nocardia nova]|uniref:Uncharacterized protein n=1 Tax=Nocardia nova TaxID=37330 RepID=A0A2S6A506_9NOCA|nr:hypothetical protein [Nocardia nova]PPJ27229.1 hypothetical protein C5F51_18480 [Nocardia nova]